MKIFLNSTGERFFVFPGLCPGPTYAAPMALFVLRSFFYAFASQP